jgi:hypothetical protein
MHGKIKTRTKVKMMFCQRKQEPEDIKLSHPTANERPRERSRERWKKK